VFPLGEAVVLVVNSRSSGGRVGCAISGGYKVGVDVLAGRGSTALE
jgi:hypothetical protein